MADTVKILNEGETHILNMILKTNPIQLWLHSTDTTLNPVQENWVFSTFSTAGAPFKTIATTDWTVSGNVATAPAQELVGVPTAVYYGAILKDSVTGKSLSVMTFDTPITIGAGGGSVIVTPSFTLPEEA